MEHLRHELGEGCVDFTPADRERRMEQLATCREDALEAYLDGGEVPDALVRQLVGRRLVFPCWFGSGLKLEGIDEFLEGLARYVEPPVYPETFSARVFKISHDPQGKRLTHLKVTGGSGTPCPMPGTRRRPPSCAFTAAAGSGRWTRSPPEACAPSRD